jgi:hypothetical protein
MLVCQALWQTAAEQVLNEKHRNDGGSAVPAEKTG